VYPKVDTAAGTLMDVSVWVVRLPLWDKLGPLRYWQVGGRGLCLGAGKTRSQSAEGGGLFREKCL